MDPCQKRNQAVITHPKLVLKRLWAFIATDNMGLSACVASTIGSLTHRHFYGWKRCNRSIRGKRTEEENLRKRHRRRQTIRNERQIEKRFKG